MFLFLFPRREEGWKMNTGKMPELKDGHFMFYVDESMLTEFGYKPSIVVEGESGHFPNGGGDVEPWYWGMDISIAKECARDKNEKMGLTEADEDRILVSSMLTVSPNLSI